METERNLKVAAAASGGQAEASVRQSWRLLWLIVSFFASGQMHGCAFTFRYGPETRQAGTVMVCSFSGGEWKFGSITRSAKLYSTTSAALRRCRD